MADDFAGRLRGENENGVENGTVFDNPAFDLDGSGPIIEEDYEENPDQDDANDGSDGNDAIELDDNEDGNQLDDSDDHNDDFDKSVH